MFQSATVIRQIAAIMQVAAITCTVLLTCVLGCRHESDQHDFLHGSAHDFHIYWPPIAPKFKEPTNKRPLLHGNVSIKETTTATEDCTLEICVTITRPSTERHRQFWNSQLSFADLPWMDQVRVWDSASKWQWPNVPFLLRRHGKERVERYGGIDPSKKVDNDFAAVLIRRYDTSDSTESADTQNSPFVSAQWYDKQWYDEQWHGKHKQGDKKQKTDIHSLVHTASSDTFRIHVARKAERSTGKHKLWLIYADLLHSRPPKSWPKEPEWSGGILTYCEINWEKRPNQRTRGTVQFLAPTESTGFNWKRWSEDASFPARSRLTDAPNLPEDESRH